MSIFEVMKKYFLATAILFLASVAHASPELVQIVNFEWKNGALEFTSLGSGTAIEKNLILTNKHVVTENNAPSDFILLCPAQTKSSLPVNCTISAAVVATHPTWDVALVRPLDSEVFFPSVRFVSTDPRVGDQLRVEGFPITTEKFSNFGGTQTMESIKTWLTDGGELKMRGDHITVTRGKVKKIGILQTTEEKYFLTDVKANYGNSGGAAFDQSGNFVGVPTLRDTEYNALILAVSQLTDWIDENRDGFPYVAEEVLDFYQQHLRAGATDLKSTTIFNRDLGVKRGIPRRENESLDSDQSTFVKWDDRKTMVEDNWDALNRGTGERVTRTPQYKYSLGANRHRENVSEQERSPTEVDKPSRPMYSGYRFRSRFSPPSFLKKTDD